MPEEQSNNSENKEEERRKRVKVLTILLLLLLLALLFLFFLYYLLFAPKKTIVEKGKGVEFLFSVYGLNRPLGVSTDKNGDIYISDTGNNRFLIFDSTGDFKKRIGSNKGASRLYGVYGSFVDDKEKKIYIADWTFRAIHVFNLDGKFLYRFPPDPLNQKYGDLGFTPYDVDLYKGKLYITSNNGVYLFTKRGMFLKHIGNPERGKEAGSYDFPNGILVDKKDGSIYVADVLNRRVVALTPKGELRWVIGKSDEGGKIVSYFGLPRSIAEDKNGRLYVTDTFRHMIVILDKKGNLISEVGDRGTEDGKFNFPEGIAVTSEGVVYVDDRENNRLQAIKISSFPKPPSASVTKYKSSFKKFK